jgi:hypothetical protein
MSEIDAQQQGQTCAIVGVGERARRLIEWVIREFPYATLRVPASDLNPRQHAVIVDLDRFTGRGEDSVVA